MQKCGKLTILESFKINESTTIVHSLCDCGNIRVSTQCELKRITSCGCDLRYAMPRINSVSKPFSIFSNTYCAYKAYSKKIKRIFSLPKGYFIKLINMNCNYCGALPFQPVVTRKHGLHFRNGIDRIDSSIGYVKYNCVPCCKNCNARKGTKDVSDFLKELQL